MPRSVNGSPRLHLVCDLDDAEEAAVVPPRRKRKADAVSDFEQAAESLPPELAADLRERQREVVNKRERAEVNDELRRLHVRSTRARSK